MPTDDFFRFKDRTLKPAAPDQIPDKVLWRYVDLAKYVSLLSTSSLFFARADHLSDPWEGRMGLEDVRAFFRQRGSRTDAELREAHREFKAALKRYRSQTCISCWHCSPFESPAMWKIYMPQSLGVAIRTTSRRLIESLATSGREIMYGEVQYVDYRTATLGQDPEGFFLRKRLEFSHEKEIRLMVTIDQQEAVQGEIARDLRVQQHFVDRQSVYHSPIPLGNMWMFEGGIYLRADIKRLIEAVVLAPGQPEWYRKAVESVTQAFGLPVTIVHPTSLDFPPFDSVEPVSTKPKSPARPRGEGAVEL